MLLGSNCNASLRLARSPPPHHWLFAQSGDQFLHRRRTGWRDHSRPGRV